MLALRQRVEDLAARYPDADVSGAAERFTAILTRMSPSVSARDVWAVFEKSPNLSMVTISKLYLGKGAIDLPAFTALDGRKVDLAAMRGKVVLVDFWSTNCGGCIQDLPKLKAVFERHHGKGFEIIGVALQNADGKRELQNMLDEYQVTWPQYYDGKGWRSDPALSNSVTDLPTNYLIDQQGRIVGFGTRKNPFKAEKIEVKLKELLEK
jgi:thiol-disulfide isomerase/thioredoxin